MAVGAYAMAILVVKAGWSFWLAMPAAMLIAMAFGLLVGLPSLRLRADYFAIATIAAAEIVRYGPERARAHRRQPGPARLSTTTLERPLRTRSRAGSRALGWSDPETLFPLLIVVWIVARLATVGAALRPSARPGDGCCGRSARTRTPRGRSARTRSPTSSSRSRSRRRSARSPGFFLALDLAFIHPDDFDPLFTFIGFGSSCWAASRTTGASRSARSSCGRSSRARASSSCRSAPSTIAAVRFIFVGLVLILLMAFRPQGIFGKRRRWSLVSDSPDGGDRFCEVQGDVVEAVRRDPRGRRRDARRRGRVDHRPDRPERRRQDDALQRDHRLLPRRPRRRVASRAEPIFGRPPHAIARLGMVRTFQITKALARMPVIDNMMLAAPDQPGEKLRNVVFRPRRRPRARAGGARAGDGAARGLQPRRGSPTSTPGRSPAGSASCSSSRAR